MFDIYILDISNEKYRIYENQVKYIIFSYSIFNHMFDIGDYIYIKKYHGNKLLADTKKYYIIVGLDKKIEKKKCTGTFQKYAVLDNGEKQLVYTYDCYTKKRKFYVEKIPRWYHRICCCFYKL